MLQMKLGELLVAAGAITEEQLEQGLALQKEKKQRLGTVLISSGIISENQLIEALQMQLGIDYVDLTKVNIPTELAQAVPKSLAKQYQVVPVRMVKDELYLAMSDPLNFYATEEVRKAVHKKVIPLVAKASAIDHSIQTLYGNEGAARAIEEMKREAAGQQDQYSQDSAFVTNQIGEDAVNSAPTIRLVNSIIERALTEHASDIHVEPRENELVVRMRIDGLMRDIMTVPKDLQSSVISRIKVMSGMDISERRVPQDGRFNVRVKDRDVDLRVSTLPTVYGEKIVSRLLDKSAGRITRESVGLAGADLEKFNKMLDARSGVILVAGPTGSGKSTTMYVMINALNTPDVNLVTLEDPVEYNIDGVNQVQINEKTDLTFASGLRAILRQDPDVIAVGEIRDGETADIAMRSAITGHVVLSTIHTNDALGTIERLKDVGVEPYLISSALRGVISQRLVRRVCPHCKKPYTPTQEELDRLRIAPEPGLTFYRGSGCPDCYNTGYKGRIAVFEMLTVDAGLRRLISVSADREKMEEYLKRTDFVSLHDNAVRLVKEGVTTGEEVLRVINLDQ